MNYVSLSFDDLISSLDQIEALVFVAMNADITEFNSKTIFHYFMAISSIIENLKIRSGTTERM